MNISAKTIRIFKIKNRKGYAAICHSHLTEGKTLPQVYDRMIKALRRSNISVHGTVSNIKTLLRSR